MSMGQIIFLIDDLLNPNAENLILNLKKALPKQVKENDLKVIQNFASLSFKTRNPGSHGSVVNKKIFIQNISDIIEAINKALIVFEKLYLNY